MRGVSLGVAVVAVGLFFVGLGAAPFLDPPEGLHASITREMVRGGDWITLHLDGVRYFDKPPLFYWLMSAAFSVAGPTPFAARFWSALAGVGCAAVTAWLGVLLGGPRLGLLAGLMVATNLGMFLYARIVKPDLVFILCIVLAYAGFAVAYRGGGRVGLVVSYASLGLATMSKDILGAIGPLVVVGLFFWLTRERPLHAWLPWWGGGLAAAIALPWYLLVEARNRGFLWYTIVDNHLLNFLRQRMFPDEDVPLSALEFLVVTALAFLPWALALPWAFRRALARPWQGATARLWVLVALWPLVVIGFFTVSAFKLPHYGLPAFPALALLAARVWDESIDAAPGSVPPRALVTPVLVLFALAAAAFVAVWSGLLPIPTGALASLDVATRNMTSRGGPAVQSPLEPWMPILGKAALIFGAATVAMAVAAWRRSAALGVGVALATMVAFLPAIAGEGMAQFARARSARAVAEALAVRLRPGDLVAHEGPLENSGSVLLLLAEPVKVVNGLHSNLAFGATFPEARDIFWDSPRLQRAWSEPGRRFLVTSVPPQRSVVRTLPPGATHVLAQGGGRWLYSNVAD